MMKNEQQEMDSIMKLLDSPSSHEKENDSRVSSQDAPASSGDERSETTASLPTEDMKDIKVTEDTRDIRDTERLIENTVSVRAIEEVEKEVFTEIAIDGLYDEGSMVARYAETLSVVPSTANFIIGLLRWSNESVQGICPVAISYPQVAEIVGVPTTLVNKTANRLARYGIITKLRKGNHLLKKAAIYVIKEIK